MTDFKPDRLPPPSDQDTDPDTEEYFRPGNGEGSGRHLRPSRWRWRWRWRWPRWLAAIWIRRLISLALVVSLLAVLIPTVEVLSAVSRFRETVEKEEEVVVELVEPPEDRAEPFTFLVLGSDDRTGLDDLEFFGNFAGQRADVIMLVQLIPEEGRVQILSLPRDLLVEIEGHGQNRINAAYALGGAALMVNTVRRYTGLPVHHYVEIGFVGFRDLVNEMGGVPLEFNYPARDLKSGFRIEAGRWVLDGDQALAYARSRTYQELSGGGWVSVDASDIGRTGRQQHLMLAIVAELKRPSTLVGLIDMVEAFSQHVTVDPGVLERGLFDMVLPFRSINPNDIDSATLPTELGRHDGLSILRPVEPEATAMIKAFGNQTPLTTTEEPLQLEVLNGNGEPGAASYWADSLALSGFEVVRIGDAASSDFGQTVVVVRPDARQRAEQIVEHLGVGIIRVGAVDQEIDARVIVGSDAAPALVTG